MQGYNVPGRNPNSQAPWELFLGNAAHRLVAYMYGVNHPTHRAFYNQETLGAILAVFDAGAVSRLLPNERQLRPDITDITTLFVFEIKPWNERGIQEGQEEVQLYLATLNRAAAPAGNFTGGTGFDGSILVRFAQGQYIWRLEWQTTVPGVVQYRWTRSQQRFESAAQAAEVEGMVTRREQLAAFRSMVGAIIDVAGNGAVTFFWGAIFGRMGSGPGTQQPPAQGGQVLPFPARPPPIGPSRVPAAAMGQ